MMKDEKSLCSIKSVKKDVGAAALVLSAAGVNEKRVESFIVEQSLIPEAPEKVKDALKQACRGVHDSVSKLDWNSKMEILFGSVENALDFLQERKDALAKQLEAEDDERD